MRLDPTLLRYLSKEEFRTLTAVEQGMKNHELVPTELIYSIARLKHGGAKRALATLHKMKLVWHDSKKYDGFKLTYMGYDFLVLKTLALRGVICGAGTKIGVGKESDLYIVINDKDEQMALKLHRLGRVSFRSVKNNRDYLEHRKNASWMYLARLAALKEFAFMKVLYDHGFPTPKPIDNNRHGVLMSIVKGYPLCQIKVLKHPSRVYNDLMNLIIKLAQYGLIHCDFNEFNILIDDEEKVTMIDFPQMVSTSHPNAAMYFDRDVQCIRTFFSRKFNYETETWPVLEKDVVKVYDLDVEVAASGFTKDQETEFEKLSEQTRLTIDEAKKDGNIKEEYSSSDSSDPEEEGNKIVPIRNEGDEEIEQDDLKPEITDSIILPNENSKAQEKEDKSSKNETTETQENDSEEEEEEEEGIDTVEIRKKVKQSLAKKQRPKNGKRNTVKSRQKKELREVANPSHYN